MFSSPAGAPARRSRVTGTESIGGSVRSSRAGTPSAASHYGGMTQSRSSALRSGRASHLPSRASHLGAGDETLSDDVSIATTQAGEHNKRRRATARAEIESSELAEGTTLSRDDLLDITIFSQLPREARNALQNASAYEPLSATLDPVTGYAQLITQHRCFVWAYVTPSYEAPPCFEFQALTDAVTAPSMSAHALTLCCQAPRGKDREPGLLLVSPTGSIQYYENLGSAMTSQRQGQASLGLSAGEVVTRLHRCQPGQFVAATSQGRLFSIRLSASSGYMQPQAAPFTQSRSFLGRFFAAAPSIGQNENGIVSLVSRQNSDGATEVFASTAQSIQRWSLPEGGAERLVMSEDVQMLVGQHDDRIVPESQSTESLKIYDTSIAREDALIILYGFTMTKEGPVHYGLATFRTGTPELSITSSHSIVYSKLEDSRPHSQPRLALPFGGPIALVILSEAILARHLGHQGFEEVVELREAPDNRIIGSSCEGVAFEAPPNISRATVVMQSSGVVLLTFNTTAVAELASLIETSTDREQVETRRLKSKLERGIFHIESVLNPISFDLPIKLRGDLSEASEQLSDQIVRTASPALADVLDLRSQLTARLEKLHSLAVYLASNGRLGSLSPNSLRRLCADAQLIAAAIDLWELQTEFVRQRSRSQSGDTLLLRAVEEVATHRRVTGGDLLRSFFRSHLREVVPMLQAVCSLIEQDSASGIRAQSAAMNEGNRIFLAVLQASTRYRRETSQLYRLESSRISVETWTCSDKLAHMVRDQAVRTAKVINERVRQLGSFISVERGEFLTDAADEEGAQQNMQQAFKGQLCDLVARALDAYEERLQYLRAAVGAHGNLEREYLKLEAEYLSNRSQLITSLVKVGRIDRALFLAEEHQDFKTLAQLSIELPSQQRDFRLRTYIDKHGESFASALFTHYIDVGQIHTLLAQPDQTRFMLKRYLDQHPGLNRIAWLHDLATKEPKQAARRLLQQADGERSSVSSKKLMLSIAKLCHVSELNELQVATQKEQSAIETFDDQLDLVNVHDRIRSTFLAVTDDQEDFDPICSLLLETKPGFKSLFVKLAKQVHEGRALLAEDLIDLLTLHDPSDSSFADFALALEVFVRAKNIPPLRAQNVLASLWRRIILFDDWSVLTQTANLTDEQVADRLRSTALYHCLLSAAGNETTAESVLRPTECGTVPPIEALQARIAEAMLPTANDGGSTQEMEDSPRALLGQLMQDFQSEAYELQETTTACKLEQWYSEIQRLVLQEASTQMQTEYERNEMDATSMIQESHTPSEIIAM